jgi:hemerythrin-like metal-binding protein
MTDRFDASASEGAWVERPMPWLDCFDIGDNRIDREHRALLDTCNALCATAARGTDPAHAATIAGDLMAIVDVHFRSEEALFPIIRFPRQHEHCREHESIRKLLPTLLGRDALIDLRASAATARMILIEHIIRHDLSFKTFVQEMHGR